MAAMMSAWFRDEGADHVLATKFAQQSLQAIEHDESDIVKVACIRILRDYLLTLPAPMSTELQAQVVNSIASFLETQDFDDPDENMDLIDVVLQTLRDTIMANPHTCLDHNALDVLLTMVKYGAARDSHSPILIDEAFESATEAMAREGPESYARLCQKVLPSLLAAFDIEDPETKEKSALTDVACNVLQIITENATSRLPPGFITSVMPRLCRLIFTDSDIFTRQTATLIIKNMLINDKDQFISYVDPHTGQNGLEMCFIVVAHLLGPTVDDVSAAEVGQLALAVVENAGADLGNSMQQLLVVIAGRLSIAEHTPFIQSLVMVFARLAQLKPHDVVTFLVELPIDQTTALHVLLNKWFENAGVFVGFDAIRDSIHALVALYKLHDPRIEAIVVQGDLIPDTSSRIRTRSQAKTRPIQYTQVPAPLKIVKILVGELVPLNDPGKAPLKSASSQGSWESAESSNPPSSSARTADDGTQRFIVEFFKGEQSDPGFQALYRELTDEEAMRAVMAYHDMEQQKLQLGAVPRR